jgi:hypothetical protein
MNKFKLKGGKLLIVASFLCSLLFAQVSYSASQDVCSKYQNSEEQAACKKGISTAEEAKQGVINKYSVTAPPAVSIPQEGATPGQSPSLETQNQQAQVQQPAMESSANAGNQGANVQGANAPEIYTPYKTPWQKLQAPPVGKRPAAAEDQTGEAAPSDQHVNIFK